MNTPVNQTELKQWFSKWMHQLPDKQKQMAVEVLDQLLFYLSSYYQKPSRCTTVENNILRQARLFEEELTTIEDMQRLKVHHLEYVEEQFKNKYSFYALAQGGVSGLGQPLLLFLDFPALLTINLNMVHYIAGVYGYSLKDPTEHVLALKVLHAASLSKSYREPAWEWLLEQYHQENELTGYIHQNETMIQPEWLETVAKQWAKSVLLYGMNKTTRKNFSILGVVLGANVNYRFTKQIGEFSSRFYRHRFSREKEG